MVAALAASAAFSLISAKTARPLAAAARRIWRICDVIVCTAILANAVLRVTTAHALPIGPVPALGDVLWSAPSSCCGW